MTTIYCDPAAGPATHALVIGVGDYTHIHDLPRRLAAYHGVPVAAFDDLGLLAPLTSPPESARAFARWVLDEMNNPAAPLGSVEMCVSPVSSFSSTRTGEVHPQAATRDNLTAAYKRWFERCNSDERNVAIFYYCGHGFTTDDLILLPSDFGHDHESLSRNAINFLKTHLRMSSCAASTQWYFLDCCQVPSESLMSLLDDVPGLHGDTLHPSLYTSPVRPGFKFHATAPNALAFGPVGQKSRFTSALLLGLGGLGATQKDNGTRWEVRQAHLLDAVNQTMARENRQRTNQQDPVATDLRGNPVLHVLRDAPEVDYSIDTLPAAAAASATFELLDDWDNPAYCRKPTAGPWNCKVKSGIYMARATFADGLYPVHKRRAWALPPYPDALRLELAP